MSNVLAGVCFLYVGYTLGQHDGVRQTLAAVAAMDECIMALEMANHAIAELDKTVSMMFTGGK